MTSVENRSFSGEQNGQQTAGCGTAFSSANAFIGLGLMGGLICLGTGYDAWGGTIIAVTVFGAGIKLFLHYTDAGQSIVQFFAGRTFVRKNQADVKL